MRAPALVVMAALVAASACGGGLGAGGASGRPPCPPGAVEGPRGCRCRSDLRGILGACVSPGLAARYCGAAAVPGAAGCVARPECPAGTALDLGRGECTTAAVVAGLAAERGTLLGARDGVGCEAGHRLVVGSAPSAPRPDRVGCVGPSRCRRGSFRSADGRCAPEPICAAGTIFDASAGRCLPLIVAGAGDVPLVDVVRWVHATLGRDGAEGAAPLCAALAWAPGALVPALDDRAAPRGAALTTVELALRIPDNDLSLADLQARVVTGSAGRAPAEDAAEIARAVAPMADALRALGGTSTVAALALRVRCGRGTARPVALPLGRSANESENPL